MKHFKFLLFLGTTLMLLFFQNCQNKNLSADAVNGEEASVAGVLQSAGVATVRYYRGGYFPAPNSPNWSHDMSIDLRSPGASFPIQGKHPDPLCFRAGMLTSEKAEQLLNLVAALSLQVSTGPIMADGGIETVEITSKNGTFKKYHLMMGEVPSGELYATNPESLSDFLKEIHAELAVGCE